MAYGADPFDPMVPGGSYVPMALDDDSGVYVLDDERTVGRNTDIFDHCTRVQYDDGGRGAAPNQRYPGRMGANRATERIGPSLDERRYNALRSPSFRPEPGRPCAYGSSPPDTRINRGGRRERFGAGGPAGVALGYRDRLAADVRSGCSSGVPPSDADVRYGNGDPLVAASGYRGLTSSRWERPALEDINWDPRPPHYVADMPNEFAHARIDPQERGPMLFGPPSGSRAGYPSFRQVDRFAAAPAADKNCGITPSSVAVLVLFFILMVLCAMIIGVRFAIGQLREAVYESMLLGGPPLGGPPLGAINLAPA